MSDLSRLRVSLTKHGAHKVARLLQEYSIQDVLAHVDDDQLDIHIDAPQARANLSARADGSLPAYWQTVKESGQRKIELCVLYAIVFSHHRLISALVQSRCRYGVGIVKRDDVVHGKEYTNLACIFRELRSTTKETHRLFEFDTSDAFGDATTASLLREIIRDKLVAAGFDQQNETFVSACLTHRFNLVFGLGQQEFVVWLDEQRLIPSLPRDELDDELEEDELPFAELSFEPGHLQRGTGELTVTRGKQKITIRRLHNKIQNALYERLVAQFGASNVGAEQTYGGATKIDLVVRHSDDTFTFYEIKIDRSVRRCIRRALCQLLEYAYWPDRERSKQLVIVSQKPITDQAATYLRHIRRMFSIPIYYESFDETTGQFSSVS